MKKIILVLIGLLLSFNFVFGQATVFVEAPPFDNGTSFNRAPNGTSAHTYMRACALVMQNELTNIPANTQITSFGFTLNSGTNLTSVTGNFTVYIENTADVTYNKGTNYTTAISTMTNVYASVMTVPTSATSTSITITLSTPFTYTGGGLYVAYDWASTGPFDLTAAIYQCNYQGLLGGCASAASSVSAPTTLGGSNFRPCFLFGIANLLTNDIEVIGMQSIGRAPLILNTPQNIQALIKNSSNMTQNNIGVNLTITGTNPFTNSQTISTLIAGASTLVTFASYNPLIPGVSNMSVSVASDQNNNNNLSTYTQNVSCNEWSQNPASGGYTLGVGFPAGTGIIGNLYLNPVTSTLTALKAHISVDATVNGSTGYGVLLNSSGSILATTNTLTLNNAAQGTVQTFDFLTPQFLTANTTYYIGFAQTAIGIYAMGTEPYPYIPANTYVTTGLTGGILNPGPQNFGHLGIEAVFGHTANISLASTPSAMCTGFCATINALGTTNYTWSTGSTSHSISICPTSTTTYSVFGMDNIGCSSSALITLTVNQLPNIIASSNQNSICLGGTVSVHATGASTLSWSSGQTTSTFTDNPILTTTYLVTGTNTAGCTNTGAVQVFVDSYTPSISSPTAICNGNGVMISAIGVGSYTWIPSNGPFSNITVTPSVTTEYSVKVNGPNGCLGTNATTVTVNALPTITASATRSVICKGEKTTLSALGATTYTWNTSSISGSTISVTGISNITTTYSVDGTDVNGCINTGTVSVKVNACTGIDEINRSSPLISIFPNPGNGLFTLIMQNVSANSFIRIYNTLGDLVKQQNLDQAENSINIQNERSGIYFIYVFEDGNSLSVSKIIKQ